MSVTATHPATRALLALLAELDDHGIAATRDPGAFYPQPVGVLVYLPSQTKRGLGTRTYEVEIQVVSGDPLNTELAVDRLYALADDVAFALRIDTYSAGEYRPDRTSQPLPAVDLTAVLSVTETEEVP